MKIIGIKLANGDFYPVLQDNIPSEKALTLTTAHNNQTRITVDLYRSETNSMEQAEYVDSLQIENLKAHPNGEPNIAFTISLDEENELSAKIVDDETGLQSNTTITLVSRTIEERLNTDEYDIKELEQPTQKTTKRGGLLAAANALLNSPVEPSSSEKDDSEQDITIEAETLDNIETSLEDPIVIEQIEPTDEETFVTDVIDIQEENKIVSETSDIEFSDETIEAEAPIVEEIPTEVEVTEAEVTEDTNEPINENPLFSIDEDISNIDIDFTVPVSPTPANTLDSFELPPDNGFDATFDTEETVSTDDSLDISENDSPINDSLDLQNFDNTDFDVNENSISDIDEMNLDLPDFEESNFDDTDISTINIDDTSFADTNLDDSTFADSILDDTDFTDTTFGEETMNKNETTNSKGGISFTGLYDKETELGNSANSENDVSKKTKAPVIICVICAIICLLATAFLLFILPSKYNLLGKTGECEESQTEVSTSSYLEKTTQEEIPAMPEPIAETEAEEDIIIIEKAEEVIPEQPPVTTEKPKDISYKIKWGDTLWDISDTYYKNPWRYKYIARFNGIKDPDYIISGTYITIPAE